MTEPKDLGRQLRDVAHHLDARSRPVTPASARQRIPQRRPGHRRQLAAIATCAVVLLGVVAAIEIGRDEGRGLTTSGRSTTSGPDDPSPREESSYDGVPIEELPAAGIAVVEDGLLVLLDFDGTILGEARTPVADVLGTGPGRTGVVVRLGAAPIFELAEPDPAEAPEDCDEAAGAGGVRVALCGGSPQLREVIVRVDPSGEIGEIIGAAPDSGGVGHWRWALPSPDGEWILAQWSGECEIPIAFMTPLAGGEVRTVSGESGLAGALASTAVGWAPDGRAIVHFSEAACGSGLEQPGTYLVDPGSLERAVMRTDDSSPAAAYYWELRAYGNHPERAFHRALQELGLEGCCGDPSHGGSAATTGLVWNGVQIPVGSTPKTPGGGENESYVPFNDLVTDSEPIQIGGLPATAGTADLGPFVAFTCGPNVWNLGGVGPAGGDRSTSDVLRDVAAALIPHLYCTVGERPQATGHGGVELTADLDARLGEDWETSVVDALDRAGSQVEADATLVGTWWAVADYCLSSTSRGSEECHEEAAAYLMSRLGTDSRFESSHFSGAGAVGAAINDGYDGTARFLDLPPATGDISQGRPGY